MSSIDEVKSRIDIVDLVSETVQLRRSGKNYTGFCPFHENTRTPAFVVFPDSGTWRCFGQCNEGGDIFKFVMKREGWDFPEALRVLAERAGVQLKPPTPEAQAAAEENDSLRGLLEEAVIFFRHHLYNTPAGKDALEYLRTRRGLTDETIEAFGLGYGPQGWDNLTSHFLAKGFSEKDLVDAGLVSENESGRIYDRFRNRITFPIRDERGRMAGFGARILNPDDVPKFLNSPQTALFDKGGLLYGLDRARKAIRLADQAVIVEGYLDVIALHQAGFENVISPMGTALTEHQLHLLKRFSRRLVLALDPDAAGDKATLRGLQVARQSMDREADPVFDARGLLGYESRLQADIRVTTLPEGMDPDEVVNRDPAEWVKIIENARPVVIHVMETLAQGKNLEDPKVKDELAAQVLPLIDDVPSPIERDTYLQRLARLLRVSEDALLSGGRAPQRRRPAYRSRENQQPQAAAPARSFASAMDSGQSLEAHLLGVLLRKPNLLFRMDRELQAANLPRLSVEDFQHAGHQVIFRLLQEGIDQDFAEPINFVMGSFSLPMMELADGLLERTEKVDPVEDRVLEDLMRTVLYMRQRNLHQDAEYLHFLIEDEQEHGDPKAAQYGEAVLRYQKTRANLDRALGRYTGHQSISR